MGCILSKFLSTIEVVETRTNTSSAANSALIARSTTQKNNGSIRASSNPAASTSVAVQCTQGRGGTKKYTFEEDLNVIMHYRKMLKENIPPQVVMIAILQCNIEKDLINQIFAAEEPPAMRYREMIIRCIPPPLVLHIMKEQSVDPHIFSFVFEGGEAAKNPLFTQWTGEFMKIQKKCKDLESREDGTLEEYVDIMEQFRLRVECRDAVEKAVGVAPLWPYYILLLEYRPKLEGKILELSSQPSTNKTTAQAHSQPTSMRVKIECNEEGLVVKRVITGKSIDNRLSVIENGINFGFRQSRDYPKSPEWGVRPGWDTPYLLRDRRFSNYPDIVVCGTNEAYEEIKRRVRDGPNADLPLYLGAKLARDRKNPKACEWMVRPGWDTPNMECERCYSEFQDLIIYGTNKAYNELENKIKGIGGTGSDPFKAKISTPNKNGNDGKEGKFAGWKKQVFDLERMCRDLYFNGGSHQQFSDTLKSLESVKTTGSICASQSEWIDIYKPYMLMIHGLQQFCQSKIQEHSFGPSGTREEAIGEKADGGPPLSDLEAAKRPEFVEWRNRFIAVENMYKDLEIRGTGTRREYEEIMQQLRIRVIWTDIVEEAVGGAPLRPYFVLFQIYEAILKIKIESLSTKQPENTKHTSQHHDQKTWKTMTSVSSDSADRVSKGVFPGNNITKLSNKPVNKSVSQQEQTNLTTETPKLGSDDQPLIGIRLSYILNEFVPACGEELLNSMTTTQVVNKFVIPKTLDRKESYCDMLKRQGHTAYGSSASAFISHAHKYKFMDVLSALKYHLRDDLDAYIFFDLFCINQHRTDWSYDFLTTTFMSSIHKFGRTIVVMSPWNDPVPFQRSWCVYEAYCSAVTNSKYEIALSEHDKQEFLNDIESRLQAKIQKMLATIHAEKSQSYSEEDRDRIFSVIKRSVGFAKLDSMVFECYRNWVIEVCLQAHENSNDIRSRMDASNALGYLYQDQGKYLQAEQYINEHSRLSKALFGEDAQESLASMLSLSRLYNEQGKTDEARVLCEKCLAMQSTSLGPSHEDTLTTMGNLVVIYINQGDFHKAESLCAECLEKKKSALGSDHMLTISTMSTLAVCYDNNGKYEKAKALYEECQTKYISVLGHYHPETLKMMSNMATFFADQGDLKRAMMLYQQCLQIRKAEFGDDHPDTLLLMNNMASTYANQGELKQALFLLEDILPKQRKILGNHHRNTLTSLANLSGIYHRQGESYKAEIHLEECLAGQKATLGDGHPDTLLTLIDLGILYSNQGNYDKSISLLNECMNKQITILGHTHPITDRTRQLFSQVRKEKESSNAGKLLK